MQNIFINLFFNILIKFANLKQDYIGFPLRLNFFFDFIIGFVIATTLTAVSFRLGKKIRILLFKKKKIIEEDFLIDIGLGYIIIATGIGLLGFFSVLNSIAISVYLILTTLAALFPIHNLKISIRRFYVSLRRILSQISTNRFVFIWVSLFVFLAFINLINPEIREDQYHVDLPVQYLRAQTIMIPSREVLQISASPLLGEMYYTIGIFLGSKESARSIHFIFYLLVLLALFRFAKRKDYGFAIYGPLVFAATPIVIQETSSMYVDFQWIFCFLLSVFILTKDKQLTKSDLILSGIFWGAMIATKLWTIAFFPVPVLYLWFINRTKGKNYSIKSMLYFTLFSFTVPLLWYLRAFILMGNPFYPAFQHQEALYSLAGGSGGFDHLGFNYNLFSTEHFHVFSPLFFLGIFFLLYKFKENIKELIRLKLFIFLVIFLLLILFAVPYFLGRYLLGLYVLFAIIASFGISKLFPKIKFIRLLCNLGLLILFAYYFINIVLVLPYSFGLADKNKYLTRILSRDSSSYYDFGKQFDKYISKNDYIATYEGFGYYYANFHYIEVNYIFYKKSASFDLLKKNGITKLLLKNHDINDFCKKTGIKDCSQRHYSLISSYLGFTRYYLYKIK